MSIVEQLDNIIEVLEEAKELGHKLDSGVELKSQQAIKRASTDFRAKVYPTSSNVVGLFRDVLKVRDSLLGNVAEVQKLDKKVKLEAEIKAKQEALANLS